MRNRFCRVFGIRLAACCLPAFLGMGLAGCGDNPLAGQTLYAAKGKVLLPDGKPLTSGQVVFVGAKSNITAAANIESDGTFAFKGGAGAGLPEGEYKIRIDAGSSSKVTKGVRGAVQAKLVFDAVFLDEDSSGLKATVTSDETNNDFQLKLDPSVSPLQAKKSAGGGRGER